MLCFQGNWQKRIRDCLEGNSWKAIPTFLKHEARVGLKKQVICVLQSLVTCILSEFSVREQPFQCQGNERMEQISGNFAISISLYQLDTKDPVMPFYPSARDFYSSIKR
jgi:hypothetical protein